MNTWGSDTKTPKVKKLSPLKNQPVHVDTRSKIDTWNDTSSKVRDSFSNKLFEKHSFLQKTSLHQSKPLPNQTVDVSHVKPTMNTWNDQYQKSKSNIEVREFLSIK